MYNRYIPEGARYAPVDPAPAGAQSSRSPAAGGGGVRGRSGGLGGVLNSLLQGTGEAGSSSIAQGLNSLLKNFGLENLDTGDILLALIVLFLILEDGDNLDLIITLGLMILFSLGEP